MSMGMFLCLVALTQTASSLMFDAAASSYAKYKAWNTPKNGEFVFYFKTNKGNGLLVYKDHKNFEFLDVSLVNGRVRLRLSMDACSRQRAFVESNVADNRWHRVVIGFNCAETTITVDKAKSAVVNCTSKGAEGFTELNGFMFLGGLPENVSLQSLAFPSTFYEFYSEKRY